MQVNGKLQNHVLEEKENLFGFIEDAMTPTTTNKQIVRCTGCTFVIVYCILLILYKKVREYVYEID